MNEKNNKLKIKLIITIILFILALAMLGVGIWASQAGKDKFAGDIHVSTKDIDARVTAKVNGVATKTGEGYATDKIIWDRDYQNSETPFSGSWENIDFTFENTSSVIELVITVENRKVDSQINALFTTTLGNITLDNDEKEIGNTNIVAYIEAPTIIEKAVDQANHTLGVFKVILKVADKNKSVQNTDLVVSLTLTDPNSLI